MARPNALTVVDDLALSSTTVDILANIPGAVLAEDSLVQIALNGETVAIRGQISIGGNQVLPESRVTVQATVGVLPITPDDILVSTFGKGNEQITVKGTNLDAAAAREIRAKVQTFPSSDIFLLSQALRGVGIPISA